MKNEKDLVSGMEEDLQEGRSSRINLVMSGPNDEEDCISLVNVFQNIRTNHTIHRIAFN